MKKEIKTPGLKDLSLSEDNDVYYNNLVEEILCFYGYPPSSSSCTNQQEKIMWVYGIFAVKYGLAACKNLWEEKYKKEDAESLAAEVCRGFFEEFKHHLIPTESDLKDREVLDALKSGSVIRLKDDGRTNTGFLELSGSGKKA